jgi:hypothetical protein
MSLIKYEFLGKCLWVWLSALIAHFFFYLFTVSVIFSPMDFSWFYSPYNHYADDLNANVRRETGTFSTREHSQSFYIKQ